MVHGAARGDWIGWWEDLPGVFEALECAGLIDVGRAREITGGTWWGPGDPGVAGRAGGEYAMTNTRIGQVQALARQIA